VAESIILPCEYQWMQGRRRSDILTFKVCICGLQSFGKMAILHRRITSTFLKDHRPTVVAAFATVMEVASEKTVLLNVWGTAGQERYQKMMPLFFWGVACLLLVIDASSASSWDFAKRMAETELVALDLKPIVFVALNKIDLGNMIEE
jgi:Ras-related protein Rab-5C